MLVRSNSLPRPRRLRYLHTQAPAVKCKNSACKTTTGRFRRGLCGKHYQRKRLKNPTTKIQIHQQMYQYNRSPERRFSQTRHRFRYRKIVFKITLSEYKRIIENACHYCGEKYEECGSGLDRINSSIGYTIDNVVSCCGVCNMMKSNLDFEVFLSRIKKIFTNVFRT